MTLRCELLLGVLMMTVLFSCFHFTPVRNIIGKSFDVVSWTQDFSDVLNQLICCLLCCKIGGVSTVQRSHDICVFSLTNFMISGVSPTESEEFSPCHVTWQSEAGSQGEHQMHECKMKPSFCFDQRSTAPSRHQCCAVETLSVNSAASRRA